MFKSDIPCRQHTKIYLNGPDFRYGPAVNDLDCEEILMT